MPDAKKPRNQKIRNKKGFYDKVLDEAEKMDFQTAAGIEGIDDEIALLRVQIKAILRNDPENIKLMMEATRMLARLVRTRYNISKTDKKGLGDAIRNVIKEVGVPLGLEVIKRKLLPPGT